jgi:hypothetical protein
MNCVLTNEHKGHDMLELTQAAHKYRDMYGKVVKGKVMPVF